MKKAVVIAIAASLGFAGCDSNTMPGSNGAIMYAPEEGKVEAIIKMPDGSVTRIKPKRWRQRYSAIAIEADEIEFYTGIENVVMIYEHLKKEGTTQ